MMWGPYGWGHMGTWGWVWMLINWLIWIGIIVGTAVIVLRVFRQPADRPKIDDNPLSILKRRYAAGEINKEEFERIKAEIKD